jgi:hypothetical protein
MNLSIGKTGSNDFDKSILTILCKNKVENETIQDRSRNREKKKFLRNPSTIRMTR